MIRIFFIAVREKYLFSQYHLFSGNTVKQEIKVCNAIWIGCRVRKPDILLKISFLMEKVAQISFQFSIYQNRWLKIWYRQFG